MNNLNKIPQDQDKFSDSIKFDYFLEQNNVSEKNNEQKKDNKMLNAYIITISKQMEKLLTTLERTSTKKATPTRSYILEFSAVLIACALIIFLITYYSISKKQEYLKQEINHNLETKFSAIEQIISNKIFSTDETTNKYTNERTYIINKLNEIEKNISNTTETNTVEENSTQILQSTLNSIENSTTQETIAPVPPENNITEPEPVTAEQSTAALIALNKIEQDFQKQDQLSTITPISNPEPTTSSLSDEKRSIVFANAYVKMGWASSQQNKFEKAIDEYRTAIKYHPGLGIAYYNIACCYLKLNDNDSAMEWLRKGRPYFDNSILETAKFDPDLTNLKDNSEFNFLMFGERN